MTTSPSLRRSALLDAGLYAASSAFAVGAALWAGIPQFREWGRLAAVPYAAGVIGSALLARRGATVRARAWLAVGILAGSALLPLALETVWRAQTAPGLHAQSEAIVTEEAARALLDGRDPYTATYLHGPLSARPVPTKTHFPYLPGMVSFGLPRALDWTGPLSDARVAFSTFTLAVVALALLGRSSPSAARLRVAQVLVVLPTGALPMATGGDDLPVLSLMLLALVWLREGRPGSAGLAAGLAAALKQTAWVLLPFLLLGARDRRRLVAGLAVVLPIVVPFVVWDPSAFVEDTIRFPLGLGRGLSAAGTPTLGSALVHAFPGARPAVTAALALAVLGVAVWLLVRRPWAGVSGTARSAAIVLAVAVLLTPAARFGYLIYPANLLVWAWALGDGRSDGARSGRTGEGRPRMRHGTVGP